jgi:hypothetical protein
VKNYQAQGVNERGTSRTDEGAFEAIPVRTMPEASHDDSSTVDSLDIPLNYGIVMDAVRDAVRANL